jgi:uncharacterized repeat protein (TIGR01451 family)
MQDEEPPLVITKTADSETIAPGDNVIYTITVTNPRETDALNVTVQDNYDETALPTIDVLPEAIQDTISGAQNDGDIITWQLGDLLAGEVWTASYTATAALAFESDLTAIYNGASAYIDGEMVAQANPVGLTVQAPRLTLTIERERVGGTGRVFPGDTIRYTIRYGNNGTAEASNVTIQATFREAVVEQVSNITNDGQLSGSSVVWNIEPVASGASDEVSFEITLKSVLLSDTEVQTQAIIEARNVESVSASDSFTPPPPLTIERERTDLNGGSIEPGDTLRFTLRFRNDGEVSASDVTIDDDFDDGVVAEVSDISNGGREADGRIEWVLSDELPPGTEQTVSYKVRLRSGIAESTEATNQATIYIGGVEVDSAQTTMIIEPPEIVGGGLQPDVQPPVFQEETTVALLVGISLLAALATVGGLATVLLRKGQWKPSYLRFFIEGVIVIVLAETVLVLAMNNTIESDGAVSIISTIAGYVFGRGVSELGGTEQPSVPEPPPSPSPAGDDESGERPTHDLER